jgi:AcrR family transcriptional regulator
MSAPPSEVRDLRERCVEEAFSIIGEVGVEGLSIREVARRLKVSHQAPYKHFASSDHLLAEVVRRTFVMFSEHLNARPTTGDPEYDLLTLGQAYFSFAMERPLHYRLMFGTPLPDPAEHPDMMREGRAAFEILLNVMRRMPGNAVSQPSHELDALFIWASIHGLATILQTEALKAAGLDGLLPREALQSTLFRIGQALRDRMPSARTERPSPDPKPPHPEADASGRP